MSIFTYGLPLPKIEDSTVPRTRYQPGVFEIIAAFLRGVSAGTRAMFIVTGLLSIAFGAIVVNRPAAGALTIALLFGLFSIASGVTAIMQEDELRRTGNVLHSVPPTAA